MSSMPLILEVPSFLEESPFTRIAAIAVLTCCVLFDAFQVVVVFARARKGHRYSMMPVPMVASFIFVAFASEPVLFNRDPWWLFKILDVVAFVVGYPVFLLTVNGTVWLLFSLFPDGARDSSMKIANSRNFMYPVLRFSLDGNRVFAEVIRTEERLTRASRLVVKSGRMLGSYIADSSGAEYRIDQVQELHRLDERYSRGLAGLVERFLFLTNPSAITDPIVRVAYRLSAEPVSMSLDEVRTVVMRDIDRTPGMTPGLDPSTDARVAHIKRRLNAAESIPELIQTLMKCGF